MNGGGKVARPYRRLPHPVKLGRTMAAGRQYSRGMPSNAAAPGVHPPNEQYLEAILYLEEEGSQVIQARLAEHVGHSAPTVSEMVHRLKEAGYIEVKGRSIILTASGRKLATSVIRKHRLAERLLTDVIGLPWHKVHAEADRWEHVISDEVEARRTALACDRARRVRPGRTRVPGHARVYTGRRSDRGRSRPGRDFGAGGRRGHRGVGRFPGQAALHHACDNHAGTPDKGPSVQAAAVALTTLPWAAQGRRLPSSTL